MSNNSIIIKKKKVHGGHAHHGGSWKVAYADFVTAMMAFFMVLWIMGMSPDTKTSIQGYFNDPQGFMRTPPLSKNLVALKTVTRYKPRNTTSSGNGTGSHSGIATTEYDEAETLKTSISKAMQDMPDMKKIAKHVEMSITSEGLRIELVEDAGNVFFESGSAALRSDGAKILKLIAPIIARTDRKIVVEGHTDSKPYTGTEYTNWELSTDRARTIRIGLGRLGLVIKRFSGVRGLADTQLRYPDKPLDPHNRRVSLLLPWSGAEDPASPKARINANIKASLGQKPQFSTPLYSESDKPSPKPTIKPKTRAAVQAPASH